MDKAKKPPAKRKVNGYKMPDPIPKGEVLQDLYKKQWKLGASIGKGGFGEIYSAQEADSKGSNYPYVIKIEPHENGPLFVEMHFYSRNGKKIDVDAFKAQKKLKSFGMPIFIGSGSHEFKGKKYRFVVMEKFGSDIWKLYLSNNKKFPAATVYKLGLQMLDVLEYIHQRGYIHADIKGANILLGENDKNQAYLVDFGLAGKYTSETVFKPDPKKMHDGTIEYLSRDAHKGVQTRRGDLEILAYNMIHWLGCTLPWETNTTNPKTVEESKNKHMDDIPMFMKTCFKNAGPDAIVKYLKYINGMKFNESPDYDKIRQIFRVELKKQGGSESSPLQFKSAQKRKSAAMEEQSDDDSKENISEPDIPAERNTPRKQRMERRNLTKDTDVQPVKRGRKPKAGNEEDVKKTPVKRGRKKKVEVNGDADVDTAEISNEEEGEEVKKAPVKRGRKKKAEVNEDAEMDNAEMKRIKEKIGKSEVIETAEMKRIKEKIAARTKAKTSSRVAKKPIVTTKDDDTDDEEENPTIENNDESDDDLIPDSGDEEVMPVSRRARR